MQMRLHAREASYCFQNAVVREFLFLIIRLVDIEQNHLEAGWLSSWQR